MSIDLMKENSLFTICYLCKVMIHSPDGDTDFFDIGTFSIPNLPMLHTMNVNWSNGKTRNKLITINIMRQY